jgi:hypothetical protein
MAVEKTEKRLDKYDRIRAVAGILAENTAFATGLNILSI